MSTRLQWSRDGAGATEHRFIQTNGISMHVVERGEGPLVVLCHGFPETSYTWRHQVGPLALAGWHVAAPDQRGYGKTDCPEKTDAYHILNLVADMVGLVQALGHTRAAIIGCDWGSAVAAHCALLRPDVPFRRRAWGKHPPTEFFKKISRDKVFYQLYLQEPGRADAELGTDPRRSLLTLLCSLSGDVPPEKRWQHMVDPTKPLLDSGTLPVSLPRWLTEEDLEVLVGDFQRTGFTGGLNWYRNIDRNWELTAFLSDARIYQPSIFVAGEADPILALYRDACSQLPETAPNLRGKVILGGVGHWLTQEQPDQLNLHLLDFLATARSELVDRGGSDTEEKRVQPDSDRRPTA